jgi:hypothetical protein
LPDDDTVFVNGAHAMQRNMGDDTLFIMNGEAGRPRVDADRRELDYSFS